MREMFVVLLQKCAARHPLVVVIEDLHWSDPTTVEWLGRSFDALASVPCLVLLTHRPAFTSPWLPRAHLLSLALGPLDPAQAESLVSNVAGERALPDEVRRRIVGQTDGVPLFVEELTKTILDRQAPSEELPRPRQGSSAEIPATLRDSLMARLDHAGAAKETAQWAAVLGREFSYPVLRAVVPYDEGHLQDDLAALVEADLVQAQGPAPQVGFTFKHALIQEAAYASLLRQTRQDYHRRIAETLETHFPQVAETQPEVLAEHYANAGLHAQAVDGWLRAGERATAQGATSEARTFFDRAMRADRAQGMASGAGGRCWDGRMFLICAGSGKRKRRTWQRCWNWPKHSTMIRGGQKSRLRQTRLCRHAGRLPRHSPSCRSGGRGGTARGQPALELQALAYKAQTLTFFGDAHGEAACSAYLGYVLEDMGNLALAAEHLARAGCDVSPGWHGARPVHSTSCTGAGSRWPKASGKRRSSWRSRCGSIFAGMELREYARPLGYTCVSRMSWMQSNRLTSSHAR